MTSPRRSLLSPRLLLLFLAVACGGEDPIAGGGPPSGPEFDFAPGGPIADEELGDFHVRLECGVNGEPIGALILALWPENAPLGVRRFLRNASEGTYDGTRFHRILREFVVQGGDPSGTGTGLSPLGPLPLEPAADPAHHFGYGVLGLTGPPSLQFFICAAESPRVWGLDDQRVTAIGRLAEGVATFEAVAGVDTGFGGMGNERSIPIPDVRVTRALVLRGPAPAQEEIVRPTPPLNGEPEVVEVQHILVTYLERGKRFRVTRNKVDAELRAKECHALLSSGEMSWAEALATYSDELEPDQTTVPTRRISNYGVLRLEEQRARLDAEREREAYQEELAELVRRGEISGLERGRREAVHEAELVERVSRIAIERREDLHEKAYTEAAFGLKPGEITLVPFHPFDAPGGWYVLRRME